MKSLIVVAGYGKNNHNKRIEIELLNKLQDIRDEFDILYISHTPLSEVAIDLVDFSIYDSKNVMVTELKYKPKVWYDTNNNLKIESTEYFRKVTHLAIFRLLSLSYNFALHLKYEKLHYLEYDLDIKSTKTILEVDEYLDTHDSVKFIKSNSWFFGCYFAYNTEKYDFLKDFNEKTFLEYLTPTDNNFTEMAINTLLSKNKKVKILEMEKYFKGIGQKVNSLTYGDDKLSWVVPYYNRDNNLIEFLVDVNIKVSVKIKVIINDEKIVIFDINENNLGFYYIKPIIELENLKKLQVYQNDELDYEIDFTKMDKTEFIKFNKKI